MENATLPTGVSIAWSSIEAPHIVADEGVTVDIDDILHHWTRINETVAILFALNDGLGGLFVGEFGIIPYSSRKKIDLNVKEFFLQVGLRTVLTLSCL